MKFPPDARLSAWRIRVPPLASDDSYGNNGAFLVPGPHRVALQVIASDGMGWDHVSVSPQAPRTPLWDEMDFVKSIFWDDKEAVMQLHPPRSTWVNNHPYVLHLWRPLGGIEIPLPPENLVGIKAAGTFDVKFSATRSS